MYLEQQVLEKVRNPIILGRLRATTRIQPHAHRRTLTLLAFTRHAHSIR